MFGKRTNDKVLEPPPMAQANAEAVEVLRVWAAPGRPQQLTLREAEKGTFYSLVGVVSVDCALALRV